MYPNPVIPVLFIVDFPWRLKSTFCSPFDNLSPGNFSRDMQMVVATDDPATHLSKTESMISLVSSPLRCSWNALEFYRWPWPFILPQPLRLLESSYALNPATPSARIRSLTQRILTFISTASCLQTYAINTFNIELSQLFSSLQINIIQVKWDFQNYLTLFSPLLLSYYCSEGGGGKWRILQEILRYQYNNLVPAQIHGFRGIYVNT